MHAPSPPTHTHTYMLPPTTYLSESPNKMLPVPGTIQKLGILNNSQDRVKTNGLVHEICRKVRGYRKVKRCSKVTETKFKLIRTWYMASSARHKQCRKGMCSDSIQLTQFSFVGLCKRG